MSGLAGKLGERHLSRAEGGESRHRWEKSVEGAAPQMEKGRWSQMQGADKGRGGEAQGSEHR